MCTPVCVCACGSLCSPARCGCRRFWSHRSEGKGQGRLSVMGRAGKGSRAVGRARFSQQMCALVQRPQLVGERAGAERDGAAGGAPLVSTCPEHKATSPVSPNQKPPRKCEGKGGERKGEGCGSCGGSGRSSGSRLGLLQLPPPRGAFGCSSWSFTASPVVMPTALNWAQWVTFLQHVSHQAESITPVLSH